MARTPVLMGVVNVTPDSFSDGGRWLAPDAAIAHGRELLADGADILDIGGESTRPGATRPLVEEELGRVVPVIAALAQDGATVSVDTMRAEVAAAAVAAGATVVNDVSGGLADPRILEVVADAGVRYVAMHWRAHADHMRDFAVYDGPGGVVAAVRDELAARVEAILAAGVAPDRIVLDPGLGFAKGGPQLGAAAGPRATDRAGLPRAGRRQPQVLPRPAPGRPVGHGPSGRPARAREHGDHGAARAAGRLGAAGARRPRRPGRAARRGAAGRYAGKADHGDDGTRSRRMTDELAVTGIECFGQHGVFDFERREGQVFVIDLVLGIDTAPAAASDDLQDTVDYGSLVASVKAATEKDPVDLIETLAQRIADVCLLGDRVEWARVTVHKPDAPIDASFSDVALTITRKREVCP